MEGFKCSSSVVIKSKALVYFSLESSLHEQTGERPLGYSL